MNENSSLGFARLWRLCRKELLETLRDRRTIITLVLMPLLVYPILSMALNRFLLSSGTSDQAVTYRIGVATTAEAELLNRIIGSDASLPPAAVQEASGGRLAEFAIFETTSSRDSSGQFVAGGGVSPTVALEQSRIDLAVQIDGAAVETSAMGAVGSGWIDSGWIDSGRTDSDTGKPLSVKVTTRAGDDFAFGGRRILIERMQWFRLAMAEKRLANQNNGPDGSPIKIEMSEIGSAVSSSILASIVPLVLVLMTITGAVYPAIDLTAGERERGTMEALMASPVSPIAILFAKYIAVISVAMLTAIANLISMFTTLWVAGLLPMISGSDSFPWAEVAWILVLLVLFSAFFSAVLLALTSFARSFKEAQAYLIPVMLISITPGMLSLLPGIELSGILAVAPLVNIVLLTREVLAGTVTPAPAAAAVLSTIFYAAAALSVAARLFGADAVTRTGDASIASLFRRPKQSSMVPTAQVAAFVLAMLVSVYFVVSNGLMKHLGGFKAVMLSGGETLTAEQGVSLQIRSMLLSALALILVFGLLPLAASVLTRCRLKTTYRLHRAKIAGFVGSLLVGVSAWVIAHEAFILADQLGIGGLDEAKIASLKSVLDAWTRVPPWLMVLTLALTPAVIEELCFRGFLFSALSKILKPAQVIVTTAIVFGLFHVVTGNALLIERFVPSTLLGLMLGWIAYRTGSVFPGMLLHLVHNGLLNLVGHYHQRITWFSEDFDNQTHLPVAWLVGSLVLVSVGLGLVAISTRKTSVASPAV